MDIGSFSIALLINFGLRVVAAFAIIYVGRWLARRARPAIARFLHRPHVAETMGAMVVYQIERLSYSILYGLAILLALVVLGVPFSIVATSLGVIVLILAVALQQSLANLAATIIFIVYEPFRKGELIGTMGHTGTVDEIQLFNTVLMLGDQRRVSLANQQIQEAGVVNFSRMGVLRADVNCVVTYDADLAKVRSLLLDVAMAEPRALPEPPPDVVVTEMGEHGVHLSLRLFAPAADYSAVLSDNRARAKTALNNAGIGFAEYKYVVSGSEPEPPAA